MVASQEHYSIFDEDGNIQHLSTIHDHLAREIDGKCCNLHEDLTHIYVLTLVVCFVLLCSAAVVSRQVSYPSDRV
jgi:hypothetical protein